MSKRRSCRIGRRCRAVVACPIALVGAGGISAAHLDAYARYGLNVVAICSRDLDRARARRDANFPSARVTDDFDSSVARSGRERPRPAAHPDVRLDLMRRALNADKHVLSQKPFVENLDDGHELVELAERPRAQARRQPERPLGAAPRLYPRGCPRGPHRRGHRRSCRDPLEPWLDRGDIVRSHGRSHPLGLRRPLVRFSRERHWRTARRFVHATTARAAGQTARPPLLAQALVAFDGGQASLVFDGATRYGARDSTSVVGADGVASSQGPDLGHQTVELYTEADVARPLLTGSWFNDGFAGAMGELLCAIEDGREPLNSARGNLLSLKLCQAALRSVRTRRPGPGLSDEDEGTVSRPSPFVCDRLESGENAMEKGRAHTFGRAAAAA